MKHGDISNMCSFNIGFRCENTLLLPKSGVQHLLSNTVLGKWSNAEVDKKVLGVMNDLYWNTEYTVSLIINDETLGNSRLKKKLEDFPFNRIENVVRHISEITMWLNTGQLTYFITNDMIEKSLINSRYAVSLNDFLSIYHKRGLKRV